MSTNSTLERERRRYPRILTDIEIEFDCMGVKTREKANVLGAGGMFVQTERADLVESDVALSFKASPSSSPIQARGKICYHVPGVGMGIEFTEIREEDRQHIIGLIVGQLGERRAAKRVSLVTQIKRIDGTETSVGYSKNISVGGLFVEAENPLAPGQQAMLRFKLKEDGPIFQVRAAVVYRIAGSGMAMKFVDLPPEVCKHLQAFIEEQAG